MGLEIEGDSTNVIEYSPDLDVDLVGVVKVSTDLRLLPLDLE